MAKSTPAARKVASKVADKLEKLVRELWQQESHLTFAGGSGTDSEAAKLGADFACVCVDRLHPAIEALRRAALPTRRRRDAESLTEASPE